MKTAQIHSSPPHRVNEHPDLEGKHQQQPRIVNQIFKIQRIPNQRGEHGFEIRRAGKARQSNFKASGSGRRWQWQFWRGEHIREPISTANSINPGVRTLAHPGCKLCHSRNGCVLICRRRGNESFGPALLTSCPTAKFEQYPQNCPLVFARVSRIIICAHPA